MTGRDMLCAIAGIDDGIVSASGQFAAVESSIKADRKRIRQRFTAIGIAAVLSIAVFSAVKSMPQLFNVFRTSDITTIQTPKWDDPNETTVTPAVIIPGNTTEEDVGSASSDDQISTTGNGNEHPDTSTEHSIRTEPTSIADRQEPSEQTLPTETPPSTTNVHETSTAPLEVPSENDPPEQEGDYAAMINIAGTVYIDTYEKYYEEIDENSIRRSVSYTDGYPHNDGEQNFDRQNVDYVIIASDTVICRINGDWIVFRFFAYDNN